MLRARGVMDNITGFGPVDSGFESLRAHPKKTRIINAHLTALAMDYRRSREELRSWAKSRVPGFASPADFASMLWEKKIAIVLFFAAAILLFFFRNFVETLAVMAAFIAAGTFSMIYNRWIKVSLGFELIMLGMVLTTLAYGRVAGLLVGVVSLFLAEVITERFTHSTFISFIAVFVVVMVAPFFSSMSIVWIGIWMTLLYDAIIVPGYILLGSSIWRSLLFSLTHIVFNAWVFAIIAPRIMSVLV